MPVPAAAIHVPGRSATGVTAPKGTSKRASCQSVAGAVVYSSSVTGVSQCTTS